MPRIVKEIQDGLGERIVVKSSSHRLAELFVRVFRENFISLPDRLFVDGGVGLSNWTYHVAFSMHESARIIKLNCIFETMGKMDAAIETKDKYRELILLAE